MARKDTYASPTDAPIIDEALERFKAAAEAENEQRELELDDLRFCDPETQWPDDIRNQRESEGRPCLTVDRLGPVVHQVVNEMRQQRPQPQVNPVGDGATKETAEIIQGMIRHITYLSNGDVAIDTAYESMVRTGRGYFRVLTEYSSPESFDQDIVIERIPNPHMVYLDPSFSAPDGSDAEWGMVGTWVSKEVYKRECPKSKLADYGASEWSSIGDSAPEWADQNGCLVVEYFRKVRKPVMYSRMPDGSVVEGKAEGSVDSRESYRIEVEWFKLNAVEVLDKTIWPGKWIPIVPVLGNELIVDGKRTWSGMIRSAKDAQRAFNYWKSAQAETIALAPRAPWVGPRGFMGANKALWQVANKRPVAALEYEAFDDNNRPIEKPYRDIQEPPVMAITQAMVGAVDDLKATTGIYDPSLGNHESSQSGVAIRSLQKQGMTANFHLLDNLSRSIRHLGRILIDLIPKIYDVQRTIRIVKPDDSVDLAVINGPSGEIDKKTGMERVYDVTVGTYDVVVSVGPSYQTKRQENLALLESLMQGPMGQLLTGVAPDLVASMLDFAIAPKLQERLKKALPPQFQENEDNPQGQQIPPQFQHQMQQLMQQHEQLVQALNAAQDEVEQQKAKADAEMAKAQLDSQTKLEIARLNAETELIKVQVQIDAQKADDAINAKVAELEQQQHELEELTLAMHEGLSTPHDEATETPEQEAAETPATQAAEAKSGNEQPDPMHEVLKGHSEALKALAGAVSKMSGAKKVITDPKTGAPIGIAPSEDE